MCCSNTGQLAIFPCVTPKLVLQLAKFRARFLCQGCSPCYADKTKTGGLKGDRRTVGKGCKGCT